MAILLYANAHGLVGLHLANLCGFHGALIDSSSRPLRKAHRRKSRSIVVGRRDGERMPEPVERPLRLIRPEELGCRASEVVVDYPPADFSVDNLDGGQVVIRVDRVEINAGLGVKDDVPGTRMSPEPGIYGEAFRQRVQHMGIEEVVTAYRSPWQNAFVERLIGSIRRECLDHVIVMNEDHLRRILTDYFAYYHEARTHLSLERNSPIPRKIEPPEKGKIVAKAYLGGLHHRYTRAA